MNFPLPHGRGNDCYTGREKSTPYLDSEGGGYMIQTFDECYKPTLFLNQFSATLRSLREAAVFPLRALRNLHVIPVLSVSVVREHYYEYSSAASRTGLIAVPVEFRKS